MVGYRVVDRWRREPGRRQVSGIDAELPTHPGGDGFRSYLKDAKFEHVFESIAVALHPVAQSSVARPSGDGPPPEASPVGEPWSTYLPDGLLGDMLSATAGGSSWDCLERIGGWEKVIAWAQAAQIREIAGFAAASVTDPAYGEDPGQVEASAIAEVGLMTRLAPRTAAGRVIDAAALVERLPETLRALSEGRISLPAARAIADETSSLAAEHLEGVQARVLARAGSQTPGQIRAATRRAVARADAESLRRRAERATRERHVRLIPEPDGMATVTAYLPAPEAVAVYGVLDECARRTCGPDESRGMDALRADALVDLILARLDPADVAGVRAGEADTAGPSAGERSPEGVSVARTSPPAGRGGGESTKGSRRDRVQVQVRVTVSLTTLLGLDQLPGELAGYGAIPAATARALATQGTWHRLVTDPLTGALLDYGSTRYRPPPHLSEYVIARDQTCDFPSCRIPAHRCDLDHRVPYDSGAGSTSADNLGPRCRPHHRLKASPGWNLTREPDGTIVWRTPTGHIYRREPYPIGEIDRIRTSRGTA